MIPSIFVILDALPLTASGKVDRKALPSPDWSLEKNRQMFLPPKTSTQKEMARIWQEILGMKRVGIQDNFFDLGGHSLLLTRVIYRIQKIFTLKIPVHVFLASPTIEAASQIIDQADPEEVLKKETNSFDLSQEIQLAEDISVHELPSPILRSPKNIFLTGATGFIGSFLLYDLLKQTGAKVFCLVRASTREEGKARIQNSMNSLSLWEEAFQDRVIPLAGDLAKPRFGLSTQEYGNLTKKIDLIIHNGAFVNFAYPYAELKPANVSGTQEVLRLATQFKLKPIHYVSTLSVFSKEDIGKKGVLREEDIPTHFQSLDNGYNQSKWIAENLVKRACAERGVPIGIYRLGNVSGHSKTGAWREEDAISRVILGCIQLQAGFECDFQWQLVPVDFASQSLVYLSQHSQSLGKTFHIMNPVPISVQQIFQWIQECGFPLKVVSYEEWRKTLLTMIQQNPGKSPLEPLLQLFPEDPNFYEEIRFMNEFTTNELVKGSIELPSVGKNLFQTYLSYFADKGALLPHSIT